MKINYLFLALVFVVSAFSSCKKMEVHDPQAQLAADEVRIKEFIAKNNIPAIRHEPSGLYYQIIEPGTGSLVYAANTLITAKYTLRLLNGNTVPNQPAEPIDFSLGGVIVGWQIGIPLIQKGGKIRLIIPSGYAYGPQSRAGIPVNSVLDFDIELVNAQNN
jgi:FKBP-type peptidyl-prolyl cis-trans isomerase FkpA